MTTREEYAEAADHCLAASVEWETVNLSRFFALEKAARVLRALAEGAVLCHPDSRGCWFDEKNVGHFLYRAIEDHP